MLYAIRTVKEYVLNHTTRALKARKKRKEGIARQKVLHEAMGEIVSNFEPFLMKLFDEGLNEYLDNAPQSHSTIQATHDIRKFYVSKLKSFIKSQI